MTTDRSRTPVSVRLRTRHDRVTAAADGRRTTVTRRVWRDPSIRAGNAEPTGIHYGLTSSRLFVDIQQRSGDQVDETLGITEVT